MTSVSNQVNANQTLNIEFWKKHLANYDPKITAEIIQDIECGVPIRYTGPRYQFIQKNWPSAFKHKGQIDELVEEYLALGRVEGPLDPIPQQFHSSPLGAIPKRNTSKIRLIHDLSYPPGRATNDSIPQEYCSVSYSSVQHAVDMIQSIGAPVYMAKTDLKSAYHHITIKPEDRNLLGFSWPDAQGNLRQYRWSVLPFGLSQACATFERFSTALEHMCIERGACSTTTHYIDDLLTLATSIGECQYSLEVIMETCRLAGFTIQDEKTVYPIQVIEFLGIIIDSINQQLRISQSRLKDITDELKDWLKKDTATKREVLSIVGKLIFCSHVVKDGGIFVRRLIQLSKRPKRLFHKVKISNQAKEDIKWWLRCIESNNGVAWFKEPFDMSKALVLFTDASNLAAGIAFENSWTIVPFEGDWQWVTRKSIQYRELLAVLVAISTHADRLANHSVAMHIDNESMCYALTSAKSKDASIMSLIRAIYYYVTKYSIIYKAFHLFTDQNVLADALSRKRTDLYKSMMPGCDTEMTPMIVPILDF